MSPTVTRPPVRVRGPIGHARLSQDGAEISVTLAGDDGHVLALVMPREAAAAIGGGLTTAAQIGKDGSPDAPRERRANPVHTIEVSLDAAGRGILWRFVMKDGSLAETQMTLDLLENLRDRLPGQIEDLKALRTRKASPN